MKILAKALCTLLSLGPVAAQEQVWRQLTDPTTAELARNFAEPPAVYSSQVAWGWNGVITPEAIARDLDRILAMNLHQAWIEPGHNPEAPYLSPAYFENVKVAVAEAKKRKMYLWFDDDGGYPSGFAGGKFTNEHPELTMKALAAPEQIPVGPGETFIRPLDEKTICAVARNLETDEAVLLEPRSGEVKWTAPASGHWAVDLAHWSFRSGVTRSSNNKSGAKDNEHALMDYLSPEASRQFIGWTFEAYRQAVGADFGQTFLGFRGDEAAFGFNPWTPDFPAQFQRRKGYDLRPFLPAVAAIQLGRNRQNAAPVAASLDPAHRAFADYCDVWSDLFGQNFFSAGADWCAANHLAMQTHIEHEEILPQLAIANGDYFKCMRDIQVPGIDVIWHQVWHDVVADFPKLASSAAHLSGRPQSMSETFAAMSGNYPTPNLEEAGWILRHQLALGITHFEYMSLRASAVSGTRAGIPNRPVIPPGAPGSTPSVPARGVAPPGYRYLNDPGFPELAHAVNRTAYLLAQGRPAAQLAVYVPSSSFWLGDTATNRSFLSIVHSLLEHQRDLDFIDDYSLAHTLKQSGKELVNLSGQAYRAILIPPAIALSQAALDRLKAFASSGGRVLFLGDQPRLATGQNFLAALAPPPPDWAVREPAAEVTPRVLAALPPPDVALDQPNPGLKYNHRHVKGGEIYFFFNEGETPLQVTVRVATRGTARQAEEWDASTGKTAPLGGATFADGTATLPLSLASWGSTLVVFSSESSESAAERSPAPRN